MKQVKIFVAGSSDDLANQINSFLESNPNIDVKDIKYQMLNTQFSVLIFYANAQ